MGSKTILLVEDNKDDEILTLRALRKHCTQAQVEVVRDGEQALDYLFGLGDFAGRDLSKTPELIFLDLKLPKIDGLEVLRRLREDDWGKRIPVVILTSSQEENDIYRGYEYGANSYISKPVDFDKFNGAIGLISSYWLSLNTLPGQG